jgi:hypothetical protein
MTRARAIALLVAGVTLGVALARGIATRAIAAPRRVILLEPADGSTVGERRPEISATFAQRAEPGSLRILVDGRDVTESASVLPRSFSYEPTAELAAGRHTVVVSGTTLAGARFHATWSFITAEGSGTNSINALQPANGTRVGTTFEVTGYTLPRSRVRLEAAAGGGASTFSGSEANEIVVEATADTRGYFTARVSAPEARGVIAVRVESTAPDGSLAVRTLRVRI